MDKTDVALWQQELETLRGALELMSLHSHRKTRRCVELTENCEDLGNRVINLNRDKSNLKARSDRISQDLEEMIERNQGLCNRIREAEDQLRRGKAENARQAEKIEKLTWPRQLENKREKPDG